MGREQRRWSWCVLGCLSLVACKSEPAAKGGGVDASGSGGVVASTSAADASSDAGPVGATSSSSGGGKGGKGGADAGAGRAANGGRGSIAVQGGDVSDDAGAIDAPPTSASDVDTRLSSPNWISYGHDMSNTRHNPAETRISADNAAQLQPKWSWTTAAVTSTPAYRDGTLYFGDWQGAVVAVDAHSGRQLWRTLDPNKLIAMITTSAFVDPDALYIGGDTAIWYRVNRATGAFEWTKQASDGGSANSVSSMGRIGDLVIAGVASFQNINVLDPLVGAPTFRGSIVALVAATGEKKWEFVTTTGNGVGVSSSAAFDPGRKRMFIGTGQNYDATDSPYADSLVALDYETGKYAWHVQYTKGDSWSIDNMDDGDLDVLSTPVLYTVGGIDLVAVGDKGGSFRAFDRDGNPQWMNQLTPGGHHGGILGSPAYHDGVIYICSGDFTTDNGDLTDQSGPAASSLFALDARSGTIVWRVAIEGTCYGSVTHANGVVYLPQGNGFIRAFDDRDGRMVWSADLGISSAGGVTVADGMVFVSYGWSWSDPTTGGGVKAFGLP